MDFVAAFEEEMPHQLLGGERPGVRSRFPHDLAAFQNTRLQLEVSLGDNSMFWNCSAARHCM